MVGALKMKLNSNTEKDRHRIASASPSGPSAAVVAVDKWRPL